MLKKLVLIFFLLSTIGIGIVFAQDGVVWNNFNNQKVKKSPKASTVFTLKEKTKVTSITTFHKPIKNGIPGTLMLKDSKGHKYGPWQAKGKLNNKYWEVTPNIVLEAGKYVVLTSSPTTWFYNARSKNAGFCKIKGEVVKPVKEEKKEAEKPAVKDNSVSKVIDNNKNDQVTDGTVTLDLQQKSFSEKTTVKILELTQEQSGTIRKAGFNFLANPVKLTANDKEDVRLNRTAKISVKANGLNTLDPNMIFAGYLYQGKWNFIRVNNINLNNGIVTFKAAHLSTFAIGTISKNELNQLESKEASVEIWAIQSVSNYLQQILAANMETSFQKLGINDQNWKNKIISLVVGDYRYIESCKNFHKNKPHETIKSIFKVVCEAIMTSVKCEPDFALLAYRSQAPIDQITKSVAYSKCNEAEMGILDVIGNKFDPEIVARDSSEIVNVAISSWQIEGMEDLYIAYRDGGNMRAGFTNSRGNFQEAKNLAPETVKKFREKYLELHAATKNTTVDNLTLKEIKETNKNSMIRLENFFKKRINNEQNIRNIASSIYRYIQPLENKGVIYRSEYSELVSTYTPVENVPATYTNAKWVESVLKTTVSPEQIADALSVKYKSFTNFLKYIEQNGWIRPMAVPRPQINLTPAQPTQPAVQPTTPTQPAKEEKTDVKEPVKKIINKFVDDLFKK